MKRSKPKPERVVSPEDAELFRDAIGQVRRIELEPTVPERSRPAPERAGLRSTRPRRCARRRTLSGPAPGSRAKRSRPGGGRRSASANCGACAAANFRPGRLDLHTAAQDAELLRRSFSRGARAGSRQCVRIIHGKGLRSEGRRCSSDGRLGAAPARDVLAFRLGAGGAGGPGRCCASRYKERLLHTGSFA